MILSNSRHDSPSKGITLRPETRFSKKSMCFQAPTQAMMGCPQCHTESLNHKHKCSSTQISPPFDVVLAKALKSLISEIPLITFTAFYMWAMRTRKDGIIVINICPKAFTAAPTLPSGVRDGLWGTGGESVVAAGKILIRREFNVFFNWVFNISNCGSERLSQ